MDQLDFPLIAFPMKSTYIYHGCLWLHLDVDILRYNISCVMICNAYACAEIYYMKCYFAWGQMESILTLKVHVQFPSAYCSVLSPFEAPPKSTVNAGINQG